MSWQNISKSKGVGDLGFRGIANFNLSLLRKHFWRLQQDENSLLGKVWKSRYFLNFSIQEENLGYALSYAWRSVIESKKLVMKGTRWRIGDGLKVRVWNGNWLPLNHGFKSLSSSLWRHRETRVYDLIDHDLCN